jgi:hypothetical protein
MVKTLFGNDDFNCVLSITCMVKYLVHSEERLLYLVCSRVIYHKERFDTAIMRC